MGNNLSVSNDPKRNDNPQEVTAWQASVYGTKGAATSVHLLKDLSSSRSMRQYRTKDKRSPPKLRKTAFKSRTFCDIAPSSCQANESMTTTETEIPNGSYANAKSRKRCSVSIYGIPSKKSASRDQRFEVIDIVESDDTNSIRTHRSKTPEPPLVPEVHNIVVSGTTFDQGTTNDTSKDVKSFNESFNILSCVVSSSERKLETKIIRMIIANRTVSKLPLQFGYKTRRLFMKSYFNLPPREISSVVMDENSELSSRDDILIPVKSSSSKFVTLDQECVSHRKQLFGNDNLDSKKTISPTISNDIFQTKTIKEELVMEQKHSVPSMGKENHRMKINKDADGLIASDDYNSKICGIKGLHKSRLSQDVPIVNSSDVFARTVMTKTLNQIGRDLEYQDEYNLESESDDDDDFDPHEPDNLKSTPRVKRQRRSSQSMISNKRIRNNDNLYLISNKGTNKDTVTVHRKNENEIAEVKKMTAQVPLDRAESESRVPTCYSFDEFLLICQAIETEWKCTMSQIDDSKYFKEANCKLHPWESTTQLRAPYGRVECSTLHQIFLHTFDLHPTDVFVDIGHGLGIANLQAAFTFGCESRGIELVRNRFDASLFFQRTMQRMHHDNNELRNQHATVGTINLKQGRLEDPKNRDYIVSPPPSYENINGIFHSTTKAFVNNYDETFGQKASKTRSLVHLDSYVAGLFALMVPGSIMVTMHPLPLPPPRREVEKIRKKHGFPCENNISSFYDVDKISLGKMRGQVSWAKQRGDEDLYIYKYTRLQQQAELGIPVFLCSNPSCSNAIKGIANPAIRTEKNSAGEEGIVIETYCYNCYMIPKNLRHTNKFFYGDM